MVEVYFKIFLDLRKNCYSRTTSNYSVCDCAKYTSYKTLAERPMPAESFEEFYNKTWSRYNPSLLSDAGSVATLGGGAAYIFGSSVGGASTMVAGVGISTYSLTIRLQAFGEWHQHQAARDWAKGCVDFCECYEERNGNMNNNPHGPASF